MDPAKIDPKAWKAADRLRDRILRHDPQNRLATRKWGGNAGDRLRWAHTFDLMVRVDGRTWEQIGEVVHWLWPDPGTNSKPGVETGKFVIHSADSLREKFDRVRDAQRRAHSEISQRTPDGRPDPQASRQLKPWSGS